MTVHLERHTITLLVLRSAAPKLDEQAARTPEEAWALVEQDPGVRIGRFSVKAIPWMVPAGAMQFSRTHFPRSFAEVE